MISEEQEIFMESGDFKNILANLLARASIASPLKSQIQISINKTQKIISLSLAIFVPFGAMPRSVSNYVLKRKDISFKPHRTRFEEKDGKVDLIQEIPFSLEDQNSLRMHMVHFWNLSLRCHKMLKELALEEKIQTFAPLDFPD